MEKCRWYTLFHSYFDFAKVHNIFDMAKFFLNTRTEVGDPVEPMYECGNAFFNVIMRYCVNALVEIRECLFNVGMWECVNV